MLLLLLLHALLPVPTQCCCVAGCDTFSFGVILLELLTGQRPTDPTQRPAVLYARMRRCLPAEAPAVSDASCDWGAGAATDLGSLAKRCVAAEADDRPGMEEVLEMLDGMQEGLARTGPGVVKPPICVQWHHAWDTMSNHHRGNAHLLPCIMIIAI